VEGSKRNRYLDAMGIDVWVRRPGGALEGVWVAPAATAVAGSPGAVVDDAVGAAVAPAVEAAMAHGTGPAMAHDAGPVMAHGAGPAVVPALTPAAALEMAPAPAIAPAAQPLAPAEGDQAAWEALRTEVLSCTKCTLHKTRTQGVVGVGPRRTEWMVIGEAPGAEEDRRGEPFVGRAGHLLDAMLHAIGLNRGMNVYIANVLKSRPPGNRDPKPEEVVACLPYLMRQIALLQPRLMLAVGRIAAQNLLATDLSLSRLRGKVHHFGELNTPLIVTYHPAYLLRTPADKRKAWEDLKFARSVFRQLTDRVGTHGHLT